MTQARNEITTATPVQENKKTKATVLQSVITGSIAGATEVFVDHPLWSIKTRLQRGAPFTLNPLVLYRGIVPNAMSMVPITALQVGLNSVFQKMVFKEGQELTSTQSVCSAFVAGVGSAFVSCPTEMAMTYQGKAGGSFQSALKHLYSQGGWRTFFTGLPATATREGMFTSCYIAVTPMLKAKLKPYCANDETASLAAGVGAGVGATLASQGVDTVKTIQQDAKVRQSVSFWEAVTKVYSTNGVHGFFKGSIPRGARVVSAVTLMGAVNEKMEAFFLQDSEKSKSVAEDKTKKMKI